MTDELTAIEQKLDRIIHLLELTAPSALPAGWYRAKLIEVSSERTRHTDKPYIQQKFQLEVLPSRVVVGRFFPHTGKWLPPTNEDHMWQTVEVRLVIDTYTSSSINLVQEVRFPSDAAVSPHPA